MTPSQSNPAPRRDPLREFAEEYVDEWLDETGRTVEDRARLACIRFVELRVLDAMPALKNLDEVWQEALEGQPVSPG